MSAFNTLPVIKRKNKDGWPLSSGVTFEGEQSIVCVCVCVGSCFIHTGTNPRRNGVRATI